MKMRAPQTGLGNIAVSYVGGKIAEGFVSDLMRPNMANAFTYKVWGWRPDEPCCKGKRCWCNQRPGRAYFQEEANRYYAIQKEYGLDPVKLAKDEFNAGRAYTQTELMKMAGKTPEPVKSAPVSAPTMQPIQKPAPKTESIIKAGPVTEPNAPAAPAPIVIPLVPSAEKVKQEQKKKSTAAFWLTSLGLLLFS